MKIVLLEDDYLQAEAIREDISREIPDAELVENSTEQEFQERLDNFKKNPPDVVILDVMVRWTDPSEQAKRAPANVGSEGFMRAGLRCAKQIRELGNGIPVILYTILDPIDLKEEMSGLDLELVTKDPRNTSLLEALNRLRQGR